MREEDSPSRPTGRFQTVAAVARGFDVSEVTLYRAIHDGEFPAIKVRGRYVMPSSAVDAMEAAALASGGVVDTGEWLRDEPRNGPSSGLVAPAALPAERERLRRSACNRGADHARESRPGGKHPPELYGRHRVTGRSNGEPTVMPSGFGYVSVPSMLGPDDAETALQRWTHQLARLAAREGYAFAGVFADVRGQTETGLYRLLQVLRAGEGVAVLAPDLDHLRHVGCLTGADQRTAARYLRARLVLAAPLLAAGVQR